MPLVYPTLEGALEVHKITVEVSGGGADAILDPGKLESVLTHIQNDDYYPDFESKLTHLFFCANKFHCFQDGNKRIAISLCAQMLLLNGYLYCTSRFIWEMENISYHVANGRIDKHLLREIIHSIVFEEFDTDEPLKLKLLEAIRDSEDETQTP